MDIRSRVVVDPFGQMLNGYRQAQKDYYDRALKAAQIKNYAARTQATLDANRRTNELHPYQRDIAKSNADEALWRMDSAEIRWGQMLDKGELGLQQQRLNLSHTQLGNAQAQQNLDQSRWRFDQEKQTAGAAPGAASSRLSITPLTQAPRPPSTLFDNPTARAMADPFTVQDDPAARARIASEAKRAPAASPSTTFGAAIGVGEDDSADVGYDMQRILGAGF